MNEMFSQGGKGSTGILTNKQSIARHFGVKQSEVVYFSVGAVLSGYKVIYDKESQRAYSLPADIGSGVTAVSLSPAGVLVHSAGNVDLGALAVAREEYVTLPGSFDTGVTVNTKNELVVFTDGKYRWDGALPKEVPSGSTPDSTGGVGPSAWVIVDDAALRTELKSPGGDKLVGSSHGGSSVFEDYAIKKGVFPLTNIYPTMTNEQINTLLAFGGGVYFNAGDYTVASTAGTIKFGQNTQVFSILMRS